MTRNSNFRLSPPNFLTFPGQLWVLQGLAFDPTGIHALGLILSGMIFALVHPDAWIDVFRKVGDENKITWGQFAAAEGIRFLGGMAFVALLHAPGAVVLPVIGGLSLPSFGVHAIVFNLPFVVWTIRRVRQGLIVHKVVRLFFIGSPGPDPHSALGPGAYPLISSDENHLFCFCRISIVWTVSSSHWRNNALTSV